MALITMIFWGRLGKVVFKATVSFVPPKFTTTKNLKSLKCSLKMLNFAFVTIK